MGTGYFYADEPMFICFNYFKADFFHSTAGPFYHQVDRHVGLLGIVDSLRDLFGKKHG